MWLLLESLAELIAERKDAVSQSAVAERAGLSRMVTSYWMILMSEEDLVDRGPDEDGRTYRIWMTEAGAATLRQCNDRLEARRLDLVVDAANPGDGHEVVLSEDVAHELDRAALHVVHAAKRLVSRADNVHVFLNLGRVDHRASGDGGCRIRTATPQENFATACSCCRVRACSSGRF
jgi:DNA-binding MarR family transcriptional regulator